MQAAPPADVFNIEVDCHHVYEVGDVGVLVHNACGDSRKLGLDLAMGSKTLAKGMREGGYQAGHIVPASRVWSGRSKKVNDALGWAHDALDAAGIGKNLRPNGFWTDSARHLGSHTDQYLIDLGDALKDLTKPADVEAALNKMLNALFSGKY